MYHQQCSTQYHNHTNAHTEKKKNLCCHFFASVVLLLYAAIVSLLPVAPTAAVSVTTATVYHCYLAITRLQKAGSIRKQTEFVVVVVVAVVPVGSFSCCF